MHTHIYRCTYTLKTKKQTNKYTCMLLHMHTHKYVDVPIPTYVHTCTYIIHIYTYIKYKRMPLYTF